MDQFKVEHPMVKIEKTINAMGIEGVKAKSFIRKKATKKQIKKQTELQKILEEQGLGNKNRNRSK